MRHTTKLAFALFTLILPAAPGAAAQPQSVSSTESKIRAFKPVKGLPDENFPQYFKFSASGHNFHISENGRGRATDGKSRAHTFNLRLDRHYYLDSQFYYAEYQDDILLVCGVSDGEAGAGLIARLHGRTLSMKWRQHIRAFNVGQGLIEDNFAYLTGIGFIGKVDLDSGAYVWKREDLYDADEHGDGAFNSFQLPEIKDDVVVFRESDIHNRQAVASIQVDKRSGKIKSISR